MDPSENCKTDSNGHSSDCDVNFKTTCNNENNMSKREMRRIKRMIRLKEANKEKRRNEKVKRKISWKKRKEEGQDMGTSRKTLKLNTMEKSKCKQKIVIDCSFDHLMNDREISSLVSQIQHCYGTNRRTENPVQFYLTDFCGKLKEKLEGFGHYKSWDLNIKKESYTDVFDKKDLVYLSSESTNVLEHLDDEKIYIIGGLVDHNHHKGICYELALSNGISHAQLPIGNFMELKSRKVLAINHVFDILIKFTETGNWKEAFNTVIPLRKGMVEKENNRLFSSNKIISKDENTKCEKDNDGVCSNNIIISTNEDVIVEKENNNIFPSNEIKLSIENVNEKVNDKLFSSKIINYKDEKS